jgi:hypothetical protein
MSALAAADFFLGHAAAGPIGFGFGQHAFGTSQVGLAAMSGGCTAQPSRFFSMCVSAQSGSDR